jgi:hypothetical protein
VRDVDTAAAHYQSNLGFTLIGVVTISGWPQGAAFGLHSRKAK